jgi:biotin carboxyl carrier protein
MRYIVKIGGKSYSLNVAEDEPSDPARSGLRWKVEIDGRELLLEAMQTDSNTLSLLVNARSFEVKTERVGDGLRIFIHGRTYDVSIDDPRSLRSRKRAGLDDAGPRKLVSSMPGKVVRVLAQEGAQVLAGDGLVVVEAMKMQNEIKSPKAGVLAKLLAKPGMNVRAGDVLAIVN